MIGGTAAALLPGLRADVPVVPDAETARRWAEAELLDPVYHEQPSLLDLLWRWYDELLTRLSGASSEISSPVAVIVVAVVIALVVVALLLVTGPVRRSRRARTSVDVFGDDERTAAELRASADRHAAAGRWSQAALDRFRAIIRSLEERALLDERPGRTAQEAAAGAATVLPEVVDGLARAAGLFDDLCYGDRPGSADDDAWLRELDREVAAARPQRTLVAAGPGGEAT